jgi:hypothetical protein
MATSALLVDEHRSWLPPVPPACNIAILTFGACRAGPRSTDGAHHSPSAVPRPRRVRCWPAASGCDPPPAPGVSPSSGGPERSLQMRTAGVRQHTGVMMTTASTADIRRWARSEGLVVGDRGRLSPDVVAAYQAGLVERPTVPGASAEVAVPEKPADWPPGGQLRIAVRPIPGAQGAGRRVRARAS